MSINRDGPFGTNHIEQSAHLNETISFLSNASANRLSVQTEGFATPLSIFEISDWSIPVASDKAFWDSPFFALAADKAFPINRLCFQK